MKDCYTVPTQGGGAGIPSTNQTGTVKQCHAECSDLVKQLVDKLTSAIQSGITNAQQAATTTAATCAGCVGTSTQDCCNLATKAVNKVLGKAQDLLSQAYGYASAMGVTIPNQQQVIYGLMTGDYLGSIGCTPPVNPTALGSVGTSLGMSAPVPVPTIPIIPGQGTGQQPVTGTTTGTTPTATSTTPTGPTGTTSVPVGTNTIGTPVTPVPMPGPTPSGVTPPGPTPTGTCPPKPVSSVFTMDADSVATIPDEWVTFLKTVVFGSFDFYCLDGTEQYAWGLVNNPQLSPVSIPEPLTVPPKDVTPQDTVAPVPKPQGQPNTGGTPSLNWADPNICQTLAAFMQTLPKGDIKLADKLGFKWDGTNLTAPDWFNSLFPDQAPVGTYKGASDRLNKAVASGKQEDIIAAGIAAIATSPTTSALSSVISIRNTLGRSIIGILDFVDETLRANANRQGCDNLAAIAVGAIIAIPQIVTKWVGIDLTPMTEPWRKLLDYVCPSELPGIGDLKSAWFADMIDKPTLGCLVKANNVIQTWFDLYLDADRERPGIADQIKLSLRNGDNLGRVAAKLRKLGVTQVGDATDFWTLAQRWPGESEVLEWAQRQSNDPGVRADLDLLNGFPGRFDETMLSQIAAEGISTQYLQSLWASHWTDPNWGVLVEMYHRFRPGQVPAGQVMTEQRLRDALGRSGIAPAYHDNMIKLATPVLSHRQLRQLYTTGAITDAQLLVHLGDSGYSKADSASLLAEFNYAKLVSWGAPTIKTVITMYTKYEFTQAEATAELARLGLPAATVTGLLGSADTIRVRALRTEGMKANKTHFISGKVDLAWTITNLTALGFEPQAISELTKAWSVERDIGGKEIAAATLCKWWDSKFITANDFLARLISAGYAVADAQLIMQQCGADADTKAHKAALAAQKAADKAKAAADKAKKAQVSAQKKAQKAARQTAAKAPKSAAKATAATGQLPESTTAPTNTSGAAPEAIGS